MQMSSNIYVLEVDFFGPASVWPRVWTVFGSHIKRSERFICEPKPNKYRGHTEEIPENREKRSEYHLKGLLDHT
jgi:hypothetical protein